MEEYQNYKVNDRKSGEIGEVATLRGSRSLKQHQKVFPEREFTTISEEERIALSRAYPSSMEFSVGGSWAR